MHGVRIIGITGGSGSGKTTIVRKIAETIPDFLFIPQDNYYKSAEYMSNKNITAFNFDHPDAFDNDFIFNQLNDLKNFKEVEMPQYDFVHHKRMNESITIKPKKLIIFEGIMILYDKKIRDLIDLKLYVDTPDDIRFIRRLERDTTERGRTVESVIKQYLEVVRPGHYEFIEPTKRYADLIIPEGGFNQNALKVLIPFLKNISD
ncbi:MAG: uridine kinase [Spirochaetota bacterium]|nr:uridine kinase [Spirochaetota bacterium]